MNPIETLMEVAIHAYFRGDFDRQRRRPPGNPGEFFNNLPEQTKETLRQLKSHDFRQLRWDAINWMMH